MSVEEVALLALVYRELSGHCSVGSRSGPDDIYDDIESGDEQLNLLRMIGSAQANELDWAIVRFLTDPDEDELLKFASGLREYDSLRFEALLHAWPEGIELPVSHLDLIERWQAVEDAIDRFAAIGLTTPIGESLDNYIDAVAELSGRPREEVLSDYFKSEEKANAQ